MRRPTFPPFRALVSSSLSVLKACLDIPPNPTSFCQAGSLMAVALLAPVAYRLGIAGGEAIKEIMEGIASRAKLSDVVGEAGSWALGTLIGGCRYTPFPP